jgi:hypothetical protein
MTFKLPAYSDEQASLYIVECDADRILIHCNTSEGGLRLVPLGFQKDESRTGKIVYALCVADDAGKADVLKALRDMGVPFGYAPAGWPPSAVFELLREQGLVRGPYKQIFFRGAGAYRITLDN